LPTYLIVPRSVESCNKTLELLHLQFWQSLGTGDFNNDGNPDLILNNINSNCNTVSVVDE
jgi:hypothetical protein